MTHRGKLGAGLIAASVGIALVGRLGIIAAMPPLSGWVWPLLGAAGSAVGGSMTTPLRLRGAVAGAVLALGILFGVPSFFEVTDVVQRPSQRHNPALYVLFAMVLPGVLLFKFWARPRVPEGDEDEDKDL
ncbi:MAG: hypothetical protein AB8H86_12390 [Polyangiales bacterium]